MSESKVIVVGAGVAGLAAAFELVERGLKVEVVDRGSALGAIMGAALGESRIPKRFITGLAASSDIKSEIDDFIAAIMAQNGATAASL